MLHIFAIVAITWAVVTGAVWVTILKLHGASWYEVWAVTVDTLKSVRL